MIKFCSIINCLKSLKSLKLFNRLNLYIHDIFKRCHYCHFRKAVWWYGPGVDRACEECVPRGCDCNIDSFPLDGDYGNLDQEWFAPPEIVDTKGRRFPCCEWMWIGVDHKESDEKVIKYYEDQRKKQDEMVEEWRESNGFNDI